MKIEEVKKDILDCIADWAPCKVVFIEDISRVFSCHETYTTAVKLILSETVSWYYRAFWTEDGVEFEYLEHPKGSLDWSSIRSFFFFAMAQFRRV